MDRIGKAVAKLSEKERALVKDIVLRLIRGDMGSLDIRKLKGYSDIFRARKGKVRILYRSDSGSIVILKIGHRSENTYRRYWRG